MDSTQAAVTSNGTEAQASSESAVVSEPTLQTIAATLSELVQRQNKSEGRFQEFANDLSRVRKRQKSDAPESVGDPASAPLTRDDLTSALQLGQTMSSLPENVQKYLSEQISSGMGYGEAARMAEVVKMSLVASASSAVAKTGEPSQVPTGAAATSASRTSPAFPRSLSEYLEIARTDPVRKKQLDADPQFHPDELPHVVRR